MRLIATYLLIASAMAAQSTTSTTLTGTASAVTVTVTYSETHYQLDADGECGGGWKMTATICTYVGGIPVICTTHVAVAVNEKRHRRYTLGGPGWSVTVIVPRNGTAPSGSSNAHGVNGIPLS